MSDLFLGNFLIDKNDKEDIKNLVSFINDIINKKVDEFYKPNLKKDCEISNWQRRVL